MNVVWQPNKGAQMRAWSAIDVDEVFFGGGRGSGKTSWMLGCFGTQAGLHGKHAKGLIIRESFPEIAEVESQAIEMFVDTGMATYNISKRLFTFNNGATLELGYLSKLKDYGRYHGRAFSFIGIDELTEYSSWEMIRKLGSCLRSKNKSIRPLFRFTGNPGGRLHQEVKAYFVDPSYKGNRIIRNQENQTRMYVFSTVKDNPYLYQGGSGKYVAWLKSLPETLKRAWFEGCWDIAIGAMFYDVWKPEKMIIDPILPKHIPEHIVRKRAHDWGQTHPSCTLWYFISDGEELNDGRYFPRGAIVFYRELYTAEKVDNIWKGTGLDAYQLGKKIYETEVEAGEHHLIASGPADNQINNVGVTGIGVGEIFSQLDVPFSKSIKDAGSNVIGWNLIRTRLNGYGRGSQNKPMIYFTENCYATIRTLPTVVRHDVKIEDIAPHQEDHCLDVVKYVVLDEDVTLDNKKEAMKRLRRKQKAPVKAEM